MAAAMIQTAQSNSNIPKSRMLQSASSDQNLSACPTLPSAPSTQNLSNSGTAEWEMLDHDHVVSLNREVLRAHEELDIIRGQLSYQEVILTTETSKNADDLRAFVDNQLDVMRSAVMRSLASDRTRRLGESEKAHRNFLAMHQSTAEDVADARRYTDEQTALVMREVLAQRAMVEVLESRTFALEEQVTEMRHEMRDVQGKQKRISQRTEGLRREMLALVERERDSRISDLDKHISSELVAQIKQKVAQVDEHQQKSEERTQQVDDELHSLRTAVKLAITTQEEMAESIGKLRDLSADDVKHVREELELLQKKIWRQRSGDRMSASMERLPSYGSTLGSKRDVVISGDLIVEGNAWVGVPFKQVGLTTSGNVILGDVNEGMLKNVENSIVVSAKSAEDGHASYSGGQVMQVQGDKVRLVHMVENSKDEPRADQLV
eukprot:GEMP01042593.1.p1 GENE.GEMP01042593.1~~GEMP01042593.1.p1  ORF type:complete len:435 (+),score=117.51 GEMP01042593.1:183-1487(+)